MFFVPDSVKAQQLQNLINEIQDQIENQLLTEKQLEIKDRLLLNYQTALNRLQKTKLKHLI